MWPTQPMGETTTAADIDASGKIVTVRQVLQPNEFYRAEIGKWTKSDVLVNFGRPVETSYFPLMKREVWTYRYLEDNVWYMMYSFYFDDQGIVRLTQKTPDPLARSGSPQPVLSARSNPLRMDLQSRLFRRLFFIYCACRRILFRAQRIYFLIERFS